MSIMRKTRIIHLQEANTLSNFLSPKEQNEIVSLKITGQIGEKDFDDVLDEMCNLYGEYDDDDNFIPDKEHSAALKYLDLGECTYIDGEGLPCFGFNAQLETFILPQGITSTLENEYTQETGLSESDTLKTLVLPEGLKSVGGFNSCPNLRGIILPESLEEILSPAFGECESITSIYIPCNVKTFSGGCFAGCQLAAYEVDNKNPYFTSMDGVVYSKDFTTLVAFPSAFPDKHFTVPDTVRIIGEGAFEDSRIESIDLPQGLSVIEDDAFACSAIRSIEMPDTVTQIGRMAFWSCKELEHVRLSTELTKIPEQVFTYCFKLKELDIPPNVKAILYSSLAWNYDLKQLKLHDGLEEIVDEGPMFMESGQLREIILPKTLKKVPGGVFNYSPYIKEFRLDPANPYFSIIEGALCSKDGKVLYSVPDFYRTVCEVPDGIEVIAERALAFFPRLHKIALPSSLKIIELRVFQGCDALETILIPVGVAKVHIDAFLFCKLRLIVMEGECPPEMIGDIKHEDSRYNHVTLLVPRNAVKIYKNAPGWRCFNVSST